MTYVLFFAILVKWFWGNELPDTFGRYVVLTIIGFGIISITLQLVLKKVSYINELVPIVRNATTLIILRLLFYVYVIVLAAALIYIAPDIITPIIAYIVLIGVWFEWAISKARE